MSPGLSFSGRLSRVNHRLEFRAAMYYQAPEITSERFIGDGRYYLSGDSAILDTDGYLFFAGQNDEIITCAGYRIGPFELESALTTHKAVAEDAVVGVPDLVSGEIVKACIVLKSGYSPFEALAEELRQLVHSNLLAHVYPRVVAFVERLSTTPSGKIQRFLLRSS